MTEYKLKNFSRNHYDRKGSTIKDGDVFIECNFSQELPNTEICKDIKDLKFIKCNLCNCKPPVDAVTERCNMAQISRCSHNHPTWKKLPKCDEICIHKTATELLKTQREYSSKTGEMIREEIVNAYTDKVIK